MMSPLQSGYRAGLNAPIPGKYLNPRIRRQTVKRIQGKVTFSLGATKSGMKAGALVDDPRQCRQNLSGPKASNLAFLSPA